MRAPRRLDPDRAVEHLPRLYRAARAWTRSREEAEDLVQETLIAIHTRRETYDSNFPVTAWIHAIARYRLIDHWRRVKRRGISVPVEDATRFDLSVTVEVDVLDHVTVIFSPFANPRSVTLAEVPF